MLVSSNRIPISWGKGYYALISASAPKLYHSCKKNKPVHRHIKSYFINIFRLKCLEYYDGRHFSTNQENIEKSQTPLPILMRRALDGGKFDFNIRNWDSFTAKSYENGEIITTENTYAIHHFAGSWKTDEEKEIIKLTQKYSRFLGFKIGHNLAELNVISKNKGIIDGVLHILNKVRK